LIVMLLFAAIRRHKGLIWDWLIAAVTAAVIISPWLVYRHHLPHSHEDYGGKLTHLSNFLSALPRLGEVLRGYLGLFLQYQAAGFIWLVLMVIAILAWRELRRTSVLLLWMMTVGHLTLYAATFLVTPWKLDDLIPIVGPKLLMHAAPGAVLLIGVHLRTKDHFAFDLEKTESENSGRMEKMPI